MPNKTPPSEAEGATMSRPASKGKKYDLLFAPYQAPALRRGDRAWCLYRDRLVVCTGWSDATIAWPRCRALERPGKAGLLVDEELARAVRHESAVAVCQWWGVGKSSIQHWRKALGVGRMDSEGSRRLILANVQAVVAARGDAPPGRPEDLLWGPEELALVGALPDAEVARRTGRTLNAVRVKRKLLGRPNPEYPHYRHLPWTPEDDEAALSLPAAEVAARTGHTPGAVQTRKYKLRKRSG
jgi:hypothetical protein